MLLFCDLVLVGLAAGALALMNSAAALSEPVARTAVSVVPAGAMSQCVSEPAGVADRPEYLALARFLSRRYRIATESARSVVRAAYEAGEQFGVDPLLLLAVMAIESRFNPVAQSLMGAKGLMQIMPGQHLDKLVSYGGEDAVLDPAINIALGAQILKECIGRGGSLQTGLRIYDGARDDPASGYSGKVIAVRERLREVVGQMREPARKDVVTLTGGRRNG